MSSFLGWLWCATRLFVRASSGRQRYNILGAFNAISRELVRVSNDTYINAQTVCELLRKISALGLGLPITLVMDNARYQRCRFVQELALELNIELLFLPSYSPNLNLIERLWKFTKKNVLNCRQQRCFTDFKQSIDRCLDQLNSTYETKIASLMTLNFQTFKNVSILCV